MRSDAEFKGKKRAVVLDLVFDTEGLDLKYILAAHGVSVAEYTKWLSDESFSQSVRVLSERACAVEMTRVARALLALAKAGDTKAAKVLFDFLPEKDAAEKGDAAGENARFFEALDREILGGESP